MEKEKECLKAIPMVTLKARPKVEVTAVGLALGSAPVSGY